MRHLSPTALVRRVGRRGGCLLFFAFLDVTYGWFLLFPPLLVRASAQLVYAATVLPLWVWGGLWVGTGAVCLGAAFVRADWVAYGAAICLKISWGLLTASGWVTGRIPLGNVSAAIWLAMAGLVGILAGWPEPAPVPVRADE